MQTIQMVDLKGQYLKIKNDVNDAIQEVLDSTAFIKGAAEKEFQKALEEFLGAKHVIPCANGTDALQIAMMSLDLKPGDEVITTGFTFIATVEVLELMKLKPVIVDVEENSFNISASSIRKAITPKTKAIVPVHLFGQCADMSEIMKIADEFNLFVIEDAAQACGTDYIYKDGKRAKAGTIGNIGTTSFFPSKNLGAYGDAGAIVTNDDALAEKLRSITNHGMKVRYYYDRVGVNSRLDTLQAAILKVKLKHLNDYNEAREKAASYYDSSFKEQVKITIPYRVPYSTHIFHQYTIQIKNASRNDLKLYLEKSGIPTMIYYPVPLHLQVAYEHLHYKKGDFPVSERLCESVLSLPMHTELEAEQLKYITDKINNFLVS
jgi:UDP-2-acetamido-2-deoxy-ribo-hexuluronate aminotransferase